MAASEIAHARVIQNTAGLPQLVASPPAPVLPEPSSPPSLSSPSSDFESSFLDQATVLRSWKEGQVFSRGSRINELMIRTVL